MIDDIDELVDWQLTHNPSDDDEHYWGKPTEEINK